MRHASGKDLAYKELLEGSEALKLAISSVKTNSSNHMELFEISGNFKQLTFNAAERRPKLAIPDGIKVKSMYVKDLRDISKPGVARFMTGAKELMRESNFSIERLLEFVYSKTGRTKPE